MHIYEIAINVCLNPCTSKAIIPADGHFVSVGKNEVLDSQLLFVFTAVSEQEIVFVL